jgi:hypothetical protein
MFPEPEAAQLAPGVAEHVQVMPVRPDGKVSVTVAPATSLGPALVTVIV